MSTGIQWTDETWNPTTGCDQVSPGCDNCYALTMAKRLRGMGSPDYQNDGDSRTSGPGFAATMHPHRLDTPLRWTKPRRVFVNSMSDLFHDAVSDEFIVKVFAIMAGAPRHTFQVLTKRHGRMRSLLGGDFRAQVAEQITEYMGRHIGRPDITFDGKRADGQNLWGPRVWPLPNVWLGVSVEDQKWADLRIPALLDTPAAVRFLSCEPLLGPVDLTAKHGDIDYLDVIDWVIVGGESGPGARPMRRAWVTSIRDQCVAAGVALHFKQWGEWAPAHILEPHTIIDFGDGMHLAYKKVGKHAAGRELDGRTWDEWPVTV